MLPRLKILLAAQFLLPLALALVGLGNAHAQAVPGQGTWQDTLLGRDIYLNAVAATDASAVYLYDKTLDITWLRDANANGPMDWATAKNWAANLVTGSGPKAISDWRLPTMAANPDSNFSYNGSTAFGFNVPGSSSEMASLFYDTLGNKSGLDASGNPQAGGGLTNAGGFQNLQNNVYWLDTEYYEPYSYLAWTFAGNSGYQVFLFKNTPLYNALAVRAGDVAPVPEPETYAMLLAGLGLIGAISRRRTAKPTVSAGLPVS